MTFVREPEPARGVAVPVLPGVHRIVAPNPGVMTDHGTNTYLIDDDEGGLSVLDPGPDIAAHVAAVVQAGAGRIRRILVSHAHRDHFSAAAELRAQTGALVIAWPTSAHADFSADQPIADGATLAGLTAVHTPGHAPDHLCFGWRDSVLFTADVVMGWSSSIVNPPDGDMTAYCDSLRLLLTRPDRLYLCGHGPPVPDPHAHVRSLLAHRIRREVAIAKAVEHAPADTFGLMDRLYSKVDPMLRRAAERNVLAHLLKLQREGQVEQRGTHWHWLENPPA